MKNDNINIDDLFKEELGNYTEAPPPAVWDALEKRIIAVPPNGPNSPYRRIGYFALLLLLVASLGVSVARMLSGNAQPATGNTATSTQPIAANQGPAPAATSKTAGDAPAIKEDNNTAPANTAEQANGTPGAGSGQATLTAANNVTPSDHKHAAAKKTNTGRNNPKTGATEAEQNELVYNAAPATPLKPSVAAQTNTTDKNPATPPAAAQKKEVAKTIAPVNNVIKHHVTPHFDRFEIGIKGGIEKGFSDAGATKYLVSPYIALNLSLKLAIMTQPAIKYATVSINNIGGDKSYYKENNDSSVTKQGYATGVYTGGSPTPSLYVTNYSVKQTHDSIVKSYTNQGTYMEYDLPILMKYAITKRFAVYGGINLSYSRYSGVKENTYQANNIAITKVAAAIARDSTQTVPPHTNSVIAYEGTPISNYTGQLYSGDGAMLRYGYMLGFSCEYSTRWLFDALIQQTPTRNNIVGGYNVNFPLSTAYFRFTLGYKLTK